MGKGEAPDRQSAVKILVYGGHRPPATFEPAPVRVVWLSSPLAVESPDLREAAQGGSNPGLS